MDPVTAFIVLLSAAFVFAYLYGAAYITVDTSNHGGPALLIGVVSFVALPIGLFLWLFLRREW